MRTLNRVRLWKFSIFLMCLNGVECDCELSCCFYEYELADNCDGYRCLLSHDVLCYLWYLMMHTQTDIDLKSLFSARDEVVRDNFCCPVFVAGHGCLAWLVMFPCILHRFLRCTHVYIHKCILVCIIMHFLLVYALKSGIVHLSIAPVCCCVLVHLSLVHVFVHYIIVVPVYLIDLYVHLYPIELVVSVCCLVLATALVHILQS